PTIEISTLSLHDALPILAVLQKVRQVPGEEPSCSSELAFLFDQAFMSAAGTSPPQRLPGSRRSRGSHRRRYSSCGPARRHICCGDRKSTRLNSSHDQISY